MGGLKPCPFCGDAEVEIRENTYWTGMRSTILSVDIYHFCKGGAHPFKNVLRIRGKTREEAIERWNQREGELHD